MDMNSDVVDIWIHDVRVMPFAIHESVVHVDQIGVAEIFGALQKPYILCDPPSPRKIEICLLGPVNDRIPPRTFVRDVIDAVHMLGLHPGGIIQMYFDL